MRNKEVYCLGHKMRPITKKDQDVADIHPHEKKRFIARGKDGSTLVWVPRCNELYWSPKDTLSEPPQIWKEV